MRRRSLAGILVLMLTLVPAFVSARNVVDDSQSPGYLFVMSAASGSLEGDRLTMSGVPNVVYFSDRPNRIAGHMSIDKFIEVWGKQPASMKTDPPNAVLSVLDPSGNENAVVELLSISKEGESVVFNIKRLDGGAPLKFESSSLFIDQIPVGTPIAL
jgi:hypothetical protein